MDVITASDIVSVLLTGGSYRLSRWTNHAVDFSDVELEITEMDGETGACNDMLYSEVKDQAAYKVAEKYGERIADMSYCTFINDMIEVAA